MLLTDVHSKVIDGRISFMSEIYSKIRIATLSMESESPNEIFTMKPVLAS